jgi:hypothetical protein
MRENSSISARHLDDFKTGNNFSVYFSVGILSCFRRVQTTRAQSLSQWLSPRLLASNIATAMCIGEPLFEVPPLCRTPRQSALVFRVVSVRARATVHIYRDILVRSLLVSRQQLTPPPPPLGCCQHIHSIWTHNSPHIILFIFSMIWFEIWYIYINCNWIVTRWQCTFTHKQYRE